MLRKLAVALGVSADTLLFEEGERGPDKQLHLQFERLREFDEEDRLIAHDVLEGLILKHQAEQSVERQASQGLRKQGESAAKV